MSSSDGMDVICTVQAVLPAVFDKVICLWLFFPVHDISAYPTSFNSPESRSCSNDVLLPSDTTSLHIPPRISPKRTLVFSNNQLRPSSKLPRGEQRERSVRSNVKSNINPSGRIIKKDSKPEAEVAARSDHQISKSSRCDRVARRHVIPFPDNP